MNKEELKLELTKRGIDFASDATKSELQDLLDAAQAANAGNDTATDSNDAANAQVKKGAVSRVVFHMNDKVVRTREFNADEHGEGFMDIAAKFELTNGKKILKREDL